MKLTTHKISESVLLDHINTDKFKKARFSIVFSQPADVKSYAAGALLFPTAMRATDEFPDFAALCRRCDELYAADISDISTVRGGTSFRGLRAGMLDNKYASECELDILDGVMNAMSQIIFAPCLRENDVENEKINLINRAKARTNSSLRYAWSRFREIMMNGYPGVMSYDETIEQVQSIKRSDLLEYRENMLAYSGVEFFYCGEASAERVTELIKKHFAPLVCKRTTESSEPFQFKVKEPKYINEIGNYAQSQLICGFSTDTTLSDRDFYAMELANEIFGEGPVSKLFLNVREKRSLCYMCGSGYDEVTGILTVECGIDGKDREEAQAEIFLQLSELQKGNISDAELEAAKQAIFSDCREAEDHPEDYEEFSRIARAFGGPLTINEYRDGIARVTKSEIAEAAKKIKLDTVYFLYGTVGEGADE